jgi:uncharacterized protein YlzI (FlbEa/FlbD family)
MLPSTKTNGFIIVTPIGRASVIVNTRHIETVETATINTADHSKSVVVVTLSSGRSIKIQETTHEITEALMRQEIQ